MPALQGWVNGHAFDGGGLSAAQRRLRAFHASLLVLCRDPACDGQLLAVEDPVSPWMIGYVRWNAEDDHAFVVLANFAPEREVRITFRLPAAVGFTGPVTVRLELDHRGAQDRHLVTTDAATLTAEGWSMVLPDQSSVVLRIVRNIHVRPSAKRSCRMTRCS